MTASTSRQQMHLDMHNTLRGLTAGHLADDHSTARSFVFDAPDEPKSLVFFFYELATRDSAAAVKEAVQSLHQQLGGVGDDMEVVGAMPHWHTRAHEAISGGSPGSFPRPVYPDQVPAGWRYRFYQPVNPALDLANAAGAEPVPVAVLDTMPNLTRAHTRGTRFRSDADNHQLVETIEWVQEHARSDPGYPIAPRHAGRAAKRGGSEPRSYHMPDHGLFVCGLIHGVAPRAPLTLEPVLDDWGVGDLSLLLGALESVLARKQAGEPQIINLSLGFLPHPARLPAAWFGLQRPHDSDYLHAPEMFDPERDEHWVAANRSYVSRTVNLLEVGLRELGTYLSRNNCLVIAAAGNDSLAQVEAGQARMEPRLPARFETVLGVAATTSNPRQPARYSNVGDERELGDHVATFGGNASDEHEPEEGVIGVYSGNFPGKRTNETGWARWSGTSFATGIVSGIAANYWATRRKAQPDLHAAAVVAEMHAEATSFGPYVPALRTPAIEVRGRWRR